MGVLTNHIPLLTGLDTGIILIRESISLEWKSIIITGGFALINNNKVIILVNEAEFGSDINIDEAQENFLSLKSQLGTILEGKKKIEITSQFKKAKARYM